MAVNGHSITPPPTTKEAEWSLALTESSRRIWPQWKYTSFLRLVDSPHSQPSSTPERGQEPPRALAKLFDAVEARETFNEMRWYMIRLAQRRPAALEALL